MVKFTYKGRFLTIRIAYKKFLDWKSKQCKHVLVPFLYIKISFWKTLKSQFMAEFQTFIFGQILVVLGRYCYIDSGWQHAPIWAKILKTSWLLNHESKWFLHVVFHWKATIHIYNLKKFQKFKKFIAFTSTCPKPLNPTYRSPTPLGVNFISLNCIIAKLLCASPCSSAHAYQKVGHHLIAFEEDLVIFKALLILLRDIPLLLLSIKAIVLQSTIADDKKIAHCIMLETHLLNFVSWDYLLFFLLCNKIKIAFLLVHTH